MFAFSRVKWMRAKLEDQLKRLEYVLEIVNAAYSDVEYYIDLEDADPDGELDEFDREQGEHEVSKYDSCCRELVCVTISVYEWIMVQYKRFSFNGPLTDILHAGATAVCYFAKLNCPRKGTPGGEEYDFTLWSQSRMHRVDDDDEDEFDAFDAVKDTRLAYSKMDTIDLILKHFEDPKDFADVAEFANEIPYVLFLDFASKSLCTLLGIKLPELNQYEDRKDPKTALYEHARKVGDSARYKQQELLLRGCPGHNMYGACTNCRAVECIHGLCRKCCHRMFFVDSKPCKRHNTSCG